MRKALARVCVYLAELPVSSDRVPANPITLRAAQWLIDLANRLDPPPSLEEYQANAAAWLRTLKPEDINNGFVCGTRPLRESREMRDGRHRRDH